MIRLPPPDPFESHAVLEEGAPLAAPAAIFLVGRPSAEVDRLSEAILKARPGALIVAVR
jgi:hypothetical protein